MERIRIGGSDLEISEICLGSMTWGQQNSESDAFSQLDYALGKGVNFVDTAEMYSVPTNKDTYGSTERIIGNWMQSRKYRNQIVLATKVAGPGNWIPHIRGGRSVFNRENIEAALDGSLKRLKTDYVDIYQLHWPDRNTNCFGRLGYVHDGNEGEPNIEQTLEALTALVQKGKIRYIGLSNESAWGVMRFLDLAKANGWARVISVQNAYNLLNRTFEIGLAEVAHREGIGLLAYSPLAFGTLSGKYLGWPSRTLQNVIWKLASNAVQAFRNGKRSAMDVVDKVSAATGLNSATIRRSLTGYAEFASASRMTRLFEIIELTMQLPKDARLTLFEQYSRYSNPQAVAATKRYVALARRCNLDPSQMALAYVRQKSFVTSTIIGATSLEQLEKNIRSMELVLDATVLAEIEKIHTDQPNPAP